MAGGPRGQLLNTRNKAARLPTPLRQIVLVRVVTINMIAWVSVK